MMKKYLLTALMLVVIVALAACGGGSDIGNNSNSNTQNDNAVATPSVNNENAPEIIYTIKIGSISNEDLPELRASLEFKKYVEEESAGRIKVEIYPNGALGGDAQMAEMVSLGTLDMVLTTTSALTTYDDLFGILDMPFAFADVTDAFAAVDGELGEYLNHSLLEKAGIVNLGYMLNGVRHMVNGSRPINTPEDLAGLKMRVMESPVYISMFKALGANPTPMSFSEVYTALQQKTIEGFECSANFIYEMNFYEVQNYYSLTAHTISFLCAAMNEEKYNSLPDDLRTIVDQGAATKLIQYQRELSVDEDSEYIDKLIEVGMNVNEISSENHEKFVNAVNGMYDEYELKFGTEVFDLLRKYQ